MTIALALIGVAAYLAGAWYCFPRFLYVHKANDRYADGSGAFLMALVWPLTFPFAFMDPDESRYGIAKPPRPVKKRLALEAAQRRIEELEREAGIQ